MLIAIPVPQAAFTPFEPYDAERPSAMHIAEQSGTPVRAGVNGVGLPECIYCPSSLYTDQARRAKFNGSVVLQVTVQENGRADDIRVLRGIPFGMNEQAIKTVSQWKFKPATNGEKPVAVLTPIEINFRLN